MHRKPTAWARQTEAQQGRRASNNRRHGNTRTCKCSWSNAATCQPGVGGRLGFWSMKVGAQASAGSEKRSRRPSSAWVKAAARRRSYVAGRAPWRQRRRSHGGTAAVYVYEGVPVRSSRRVHKTIRKCARAVKETSCAPAPNDSTYISELTRSSRSDGQALVKRPLRACTERFHAHYEINSEFAQRRSSASKTSPARLHRTIPRALRN
jgi:hypothetical protein